MEHPVIRFEIVARDPAGLKRFYRELFGWTVHDTNPIGYEFLETNSRDGIPGGVRATEDGAPRIMLYVRTAALDATIHRAARLGCRVVLPRTEIPGVVTFAQISDPEGNVIGLLEA